jgi:hypothetical protein
MEKQMTAWDEVGLVVLDVVGAMPIRKLRAGTGRAAAVRNL